MSNAKMWLKIPIKAGTGRENLPTNIGINRGIGGYRIALIASEYSNLVGKKMFSFLQKNVSLKFCTTGKLIPFAVFGGANKSLKMQKKISWHSR